jgi:hypothetical protein
MSLVVVVLSSQWVQITSLNCGHQRAYCSSPKSYMSMECHGEMVLMGKLKNLEKIYLSATVFTTNPAWTALGANPGLHGERPATNHLIHCLT